MKRGAALGYWHHGAKQHNDLIDIDRVLRVLRVLNKKLTITGVPSANFP